MAEGETEDLVRKVVIFAYPCTSLYVAMTASILCLNLMCLCLELANPEVFKSPTTWSPFLGALLVSWGLSIVVLESSWSSGSANAVSSSRSFWLNFVAWDSKCCWISASYKCGDPSSGTLWGNMRMFFISWCCCQGIFRCHRLLQVEAFTSSHLLCIYYAVSCAVWYPEFTDINGSMLPTCIKILQQVQWMWCLSNVMMIPWLRGSGREVVVLDRYWAWIYRWVRLRLCGCPVALSRTRMTSKATFLDFRYNFHTSLYWYGCLTRHQHQWVATILAFPLFNE